MKSSAIRQALVVNLLLTIMCIVLLVGALLIPSSRAGVHPAHAGIMLIAHPYQNIA